MAAQHSSICPDGCGQTITAPTGADLHSMIELHRTLVHAGVSRNGGGRR
ncbi:hypothetical protein [Frankia sp. KB5]|nr:hypothetical protein [Frankia sp. KB5]